MKLLTRGSPLALHQAEKVAERIREMGHPVEIECWSTRGDREACRPLCSFGGRGAFTSCLEECLLQGRGDGAVHSLKDVPSCCRPGLAIAAVLPRDSSGDVLLCREDRTLLSLPEGGVVGTSSPRRKAQILRARPDLTVADLRGNLATRTGRLEEGHFDAIVLARAGLERLGMMPPHASDLPFLPAPCQGIIALETILDSTLYRLGASFSHMETLLCSIAERSLLSSLGVGCHVPFGARGTLSGTTLLLEAEILEFRGREAVSLSLEASVRTGDDAARAGKALGGIFRGNNAALRLLNDSLSGEDRP